MYRIQVNLDLNKTVLLREHKRHTARHVASIRSVILGGGGWVPTLVGGYLLWWGVPTLVGGYLPWWGGIYPGGGGTYSGGGYLLWWGVPTLGGGVPTLGRGGTYPRQGGYLP